MIGNSFQSLIIINAFSKSRPHFGAGNRDARPFCSAPGGGNSSKQGEKINFCRSLFPERGNLPPTSPFMSPISSARLPPQPRRCLPGQTRLHSKAEPGRTKPGLRGDTGGHGDQHPVAGACRPQPGTSQPPSSELCTPRAWASHRARLGHAHLGTAHLGLAHLSRAQLWHARLQKMGSPWQGAPIPAGM